MRFEPKSRRFIVYQLDCRTIDFQVETASKLLTIIGGPSIKGINSCTQIRVGNNGKVKVNGAKVRKIKNQTAKF